MSARAGAGLSSLKPPSKSSSLGGVPLDWGPDFGEGVPICTPPLTCLSPEPKTAEGESYDFPSAASLSSEEDSSSSEKGPSPLSSTSSRPGMPWTSPTSLNLYLMSVLRNLPSLVPPLPLPPPPLELG